ncbi:MAG: hypothetical protein ACKVIY_13775 [Acidimicrobiales bacterium]
MTTSSPTLPVTQHQPSVDPAPVGSEWTVPYTVTPTLQVGTGDGLPAESVDSVDAAVSRITALCRVVVPEPKLAEQILLELGVAPLDAHWRAWPTDPTPAGLAQHISLEDRALSLNEVPQNESSRYFNSPRSRLFPDGSAPIHPAPFPRATRSKRFHNHQPQIVGYGIASAYTALVDPRQLSSTQPSVTAPGVDFYLTHRYRQTGDTFQGDRDRGNRLPLIYVRDRGEALILAGHHRATAALLQGRPLEAIVVTGAWGAKR